MGVIRLPEFNGCLVVYINVSENVYGFVELQGECEKISISQNRTIQQVCRCTRHRTNDLKQGLGQQCGMFGEGVRAIPKGGESISERASFRHREPQPC